MGLMEDLRKEYNRDNIFQLASELEVEIVTGYPTGALVLDHQIGTMGGIPRGRLTEVYGPPAAGKTTLAIATIATAQRENPEFKAVFLDAENAVDVEYMSRCGVDLTRLIISRPEWAEQAFAIAEKAIRSGEYGIVVVDSVPALSPLAEMNGDVGDAHVGLLPRLMSQFLRRTAFAIRASGVSLVLINQVRDKISRVPFPQLETPGGYALKHHASLMIFLRNAGEIKTSSGESLGSKIAFTVKKNKIGNTYGAGEFEIWSAHGVCRPAGVIDILMERKVILMKGSWLTLDGKVLAQGRLNLVNLLYQDSELMALLESKLKV